MPHQPVALPADGFMRLANTLTLTLALTLTMTLAFTGCGRTDPPPNAPDQNTGSDPTSPVNPTADNTSLHQNLRPTASQPGTSSAAESANSTIAGQWLSIDNNMLIGLEFLPNHQLRTTRLRHADRVETDTQTHSYTLTHDGRLTFTNIAGQLEMYQLTLANNLLALTPITQVIPPYKSPTPSTSTPTQSYRYAHFPANASIAQAHTARWQAKTIAYNARRRALETFIQQPGLILTIEPAASQSHKSTPAIDELATVSERLALLVTGSRTRSVYAGQAWLDTPADIRSSVQLPVKTGVIISIKHLPQTHASYMNITLDTAQLSDTRLARILPATLRLRVTGDAEHLVIDDVIQNNLNQLQRISLTHDMDVHDVIVKKYLEETARRQTMTDAIVQTLKDYAVLKGQSAMSGDQAPGLSNDTIYLLRDTNSPTPQWLGEIHIKPVSATNEPAASRSVIPPTTLRFAAATVTLKDNRPVLVIPAGSKTYIYKLDAGFQGHWSHTGFTTAYPSQMQVAQAMAMADYKTNRKALRDKLNTITPDMTLAGFAPIVSDGEQGGRLTPVTLNITIHDDDTVTAQAHYTLYRSRVIFTGKLQQHIQGPSIILKLSHIPGAQPNVRLSAALLARRLGKQQWQLSLTGPGPLLHLQGSVQGDVQDNLSFELVDETWQARQAALIKQLLATERNLKVAWPATTPDELKQLTLKLDPLTGNIQGTYAGNGLSNTNPYKNNAGSPVQGRLSQHGIWPGLTLQITTASSQYTMELIVFEHDNQPALSGLYYNTQSPQAETYLQLEKVSK